MSSTNPSGTAGDDVSFADLLMVLVARRRLIVATALLLGLVTATAVLFRGRSYSSSTAFIAQAGRAPSAALSGIAAQFGISVPGTDANQSPQFYADFVRSRRVLGAAADSAFPGPDGLPTTLARLLDVEADNPAEVRERVIEELEGRVSAAANTRTGLITVTVRMPDAVVARNLAARLVELLNEFNLRTRQTQARAEREFTESRLEQARDELREAEDRLQAFLQHNRDYRSSPGLTFAADRLEREVSLRQQIVSTLAQAFEQARIEAVRDTPVITVVQAAEVPVRPNSRGLAVLTVLAVIGGAALGVIMALGLSAWSAIRGRPARSGGTA
ncbi:MAG: hypothetical protein AB7L66_09485 [Gemmatimonadales bacterium]